MTTIEQMVEIIATQERTYVKTNPDDSLRVYSKHTRTAEQLINDYPEKYRADLIGFEHIENHTYYPKFATMQDEWDTEKSEYISRKAEWCRKYGCD